MAPFGFPGRFMMSVLFAMPAVALESIAMLVILSDCARMASGMPGIWYSMTARVACGMTSRGASPVPPVVSMRSTVGSSAHCRSWLVSSWRSSGRSALWVRVCRFLAMISAMASPPMSLRFPACPESELVRIAYLMLFMGIRI